MAYRLINRDNHWTGGVTASPREGFTSGSAERTVDKGAREMKNCVKFDIAPFAIQHALPARGTHTPA